MHAGALAGWRQHVAGFFPVTCAWRRLRLQVSKYTPKLCFDESTEGPITLRVGEPRRERGRQDLITFCRAAGWKLAQLHDVDVVPCYHVNGRLNVLGRDKRVCSSVIYVATTSSVPSIRPAKAGRILSFGRRRLPARLSLKFEDSSTIDIHPRALRAARNFYLFYLLFLFLLRTRVTRMHGR